MAETAIVVEVPAAQPLVRDGAEGMPAHVTLLYPFTDDPHRIGRIRDVVGRFAPFDVELNGTGRFEGVLWLAPEPRHLFVAMTEALVAEFPEHPPYGGAFDSIVPHLTVAVGDDLDRIEAELRGRLPIRASVAEVALYERGPSRWTLRTRFPLGDAHEAKLAARRSRLMHTLCLRWDPELETWVYDDSEVGVFGEPFVLGADTMLTQLRALHLEASRDPFRIVFSASPFPGALAARRLHEEDGGVWYEAELAGEVLRGWLCGHFFDYFAVAPEAVYVRAEPLD